MLCHIPKQKERTDRVVSHLPQRSEETCRAPNDCPWEWNTQQSVAQQFRGPARARAEDCGSRSKASVVAREKAPAEVKHAFGSKTLQIELERGNPRKTLREELRQRQRRH